MSKNDSLNISAHIITILNQAKFHKELEILNSHSALSIIVLIL